MDARRRARGRDDEDPAQVRAGLHGRDAAAAAQDQSEGHDRRDRPGHARVRDKLKSGRRSRSPARAQRQRRRVPRRARRRHARLPAAAAGRRRPRAARPRRDALGHAPALRAPTGARHRQDHTRELACAARNIRRVIHNFRLLARRAGRQGRPARPARRRLQRRLPDLRGKEDANIHATLRSCRRPDDRHRVAR